MESFHWNRHFITGLKQVDEQHRHLVDLVNHFGEQIAQDEISMEDVDNIVGELAAYARYHFSEEETLMEQNGIAGEHMAFHMAEHHQFMAEVSSLAEGINPDDPNSMKHLLEFLIHWLVYHILGSDQNMARQLGLIEKGATADEAYEQEERSHDAATEPLLAALNGLFRQVSSRNAELRRLNQSLEDKVIARTRELHEANRHLEEIALTDLLTGLPNRRHAMRRLGTAWSEAIQNDLPLACMMIDADHFKEVNDTWGHDAGDDVLKEVARTLQHSVRNDDVACRLGGDEFFIICPDTDLQGAMHIAEITRANVAALRVPTGDGHWAGSVSIGVAVYTTDMHNEDDLMKQADRSVYLSKRDGKNCVRSVNS